MLIRYLCRITCAITKSTSSMSMHRICGEYISKDCGFFVAHCLEKEAKFADAVSIEKWNTFVNDLRMKLGFSKTVNRNLEKR